MKKTGFFFWLSVMSSFLFCLAFLSFFLSHWSWSSLFLKQVSLIPPCVFWEKKMKQDLELFLQQNKKKPLKSLGSSLEAFFQSYASVASFRWGLSWLGEVSVEVMRQDEQLDFGGDQVVLANGQVQRQVCFDPLWGKIWDFNGGNLNRLLLFLQKWEGRGQVPLIFSWDSGADWLVKWKEGSQDWWLVSFLPAFFDVSQGPPLQSTRRDHNPAIFYLLSELLYVVPRK